MHYLHHILSSSLFLNVVTIDQSKASRHFRERQRLGEKTANIKTRRYAKKTYCGKRILQTTKTYYFKRLFSYPKHFCKFFRISNALKQQRFSRELKASAKFLKEHHLLISSAIQ